jgi:hypothetical protein
MVEDCGEVNIFCIIMASAFIAKYSIYEFEPPRKSLMSNNTVNSSCSSFFSGETECTP